MEELFTSLTHAVGSTPLIALSAALLWGILSILLSPCHLASIPLIVGLIDEQNDSTPRRAFAISLLFATGMLFTIALIGVLTSALGRMMGDIGRYGNYFVALIFFIVGLHLLGVIPLGWNKPDQANRRHKGMGGAFLLGLIFGIALGPCSFAFMAPLLGITFKLGSEQPIYAGSLLVMYGIGHCGVITLAGVCTGLVQRYKEWNDRSKGAVRLKKICGILVLIGGLYMLYTSP